MTSESNQNESVKADTPNVSKLRLAEILVPLSFILVILFLDSSVAALMTNGLILWFAIRIFLLDDNPRYYGIRRDGIKLGFRDSKMLLIALLLFTRPISIIIENIMGVTQEIAPNFYEEPLLYLTSVLFIAPVFEELIFRGVLQERLSWFLPEHSANILASLFFVATHWGGATVFSFIIISVFRFIKSLFYGAIYSRTRNIVHSGFAHFADNLYAPILMVLFP